MGNLWPPRSVTANLWHMSKVTYHDILGDMPVFTNTWQLLSKAWPILAWFSETVEAAWEWGMLSLGLQSLRKSRDLWKSCKNWLCFWTDFIGWEEHSSKPRICVSQVGRRSLWTEREHCLKVSSAWQNLRSARLQGQWHLGEWLFEWQQWCCKD